MQSVHTVLAVDPRSAVLGWLSKAMIKARDDADKTLMDIAYHAGVKEGTVERWEKSEHWPRGLDSALAVYAEQTGRVGGARAMWELALDLWRQHDEMTTRLAEDAAATAAANTTPTPDESQGTPDATPSKPEAA